MLVPIVGRPGRFKTTWMVAIGRHYHSSEGGGWDVMPNMRSIHYPKERGCGRVLPFDVARLGDSRDALDQVKILMDEIWVEFDSRRSGSKANVRGTRILLQSRKRDADVIGTMQGYSQVDRRFRDNADLLFLMKRPRMGESIGHAWMYDPGPMRPLYPRPLRFDAAPVYPLFDTKEMKDRTTSWDGEVEVGVPDPPTPDPHLKTLSAPPRLGGMELPAL